MEKNLKPNENLYQIITEQELQKENEVEEKQDVKCETEINAKILDLDQKSKELKESKQELLSQKQKENEALCDTRREIAEQELKLKELNEKKKQLFLEYKEILATDYKNRKKEEEEYKKQQEEKEKKK